MVRLPAKAGPVAAVNYALLMAATRITDINDRSRDAFMEVVRVTIAEAISEGWTNAQAADALRTAIAAAELQNATPVFDEYRAEMIARTEMMTAYNDATLGSYHDMGVTEVQAIDGDTFDAKCEERDGQTYSLEAAQMETEHPNGTLDWVPVIPEMAPVAAKAKPVRTEIQYDEFGRLASVIEY